MADLLVVDDDADLAPMLADLLRAEGHEVRVAVDGIAGIRQLTERLPDLVLLDVEMPLLSGPDMAYQMFVDDCGRERIPVVLLSGVEDLDRIAACVGTPYFLTKPYLASVLLEITCRALRERRAPLPRARS